MKVVVVSLAAGVVAIVLLLVATHHMDWPGFATNLAAGLVGTLVTLVFIQSYFDSRRQQRATAIARRALQWTPLGIYLLLTGLVGALEESIEKATHFLTSNAKYFREGAGEMKGFADIWVGTLDIDVLDRCRRVHNHLNDLAEMGGGGEEISPERIIQRTHWIVRDLVFVLQAIGRKDVDESPEKLLGAVMKKWNVESLHEYRWDEK